VFGGILHRMILWDLIKVFTLALIALTGILLLAGIVTEATQRGLTPTQVIAVLPLLIPGTLPWTLPATTLFTVSLVYGRLAGDNEITAVKSAGVNVTWLLWPATFLGLAMSVATMALYYHFIPYTTQEMRSMFLRDVEELLYTLLKNDRCIKHAKLNYEIFVHQVQGRRLVDAIFKRRDPHGHYDLIAYSKEAELRVDPKKQLVHVRMRHGDVITVRDATRGHFDDWRVWEVLMPPSPFGSDRPRRAREMTWKEILLRRKMLAAEQEHRAAKIALAASRALMIQAPTDLPVHLKNMQNKQLYTNAELRALDAELHMRPAISLGCLCFVLVGCPVGIWFSKSDYLSAFITCLLPIVLIYYPLLLCGNNLAKDGRVHPILAVWAANAVLGLAAVVLLWRLQKN